MHLRERTGSLQFLRRIAQHMLYRRTGVEELSFPAQNAKNIKRVFREGAKILFAANQFCFRLPPFGALTGLLGGAADR